LIGVYTEVYRFTRITKSQEEEEEEEEEDPIEVIIILRARFKTEHPLTNVNTSATTHHRATFKIHHRAAFKTQQGFTSSCRAAFKPTRQYCHLECTRQCLRDNHPC
jgi:hypothetical protein